MMQILSLLPFFEVPDSPLTSNFKPVNMKIMNSESISRFVSKISGNPEKVLFPLEMG